MTELTLPYIRAFGPIYVLQKNPVFRPCAAGTLQYLDHDVLRSTSPADNPVVILTTANFYFVSVCFTDKAGERDQDDWHAEPIAHDITFAWWPYAECIAEIGWQGAIGRIIIFHVLGSAPVAAEHQELQVRFRGRLLRHVNLRDLVLG